MQRILEQFFTTQVTPTRDLKGRTCVITGSNVGLGYETIILLTRLNPAKLIMACRDLEKGEKAKLKILELTGFKGILEVWQIEMGSFESVKALGRKLNELERLDVLIENAGIYTTGWKVTGDGFESELQINALSTGLLALLALPILESTAKNPLPDQESFTPHLTLVGSLLHAWAKFPESKAENILATLNDQAQHFPTDRYHVSKLFVNFIAREVSALAPSIIVNVVNPGFCRSQVRREVPPGVLETILDFISRPGVEGAKVLAWAALEDTSSTPGAYVSACAIRTPSEFSTSTDGVAVGKKVWKEMSEIWIKECPELEKVLI